MQVTVILNFALSVATFGQTITVIDYKHRHVLMVGKVREELGRDQEVLPAVFGASHLDELIMHRPLIFNVHALLSRSARGVGGRGSMAWSMAWSATNECCGPG